MEIAGFDVFEVTQEGMPVQYFAEQDGAPVTPRLASVDAVRGELELREARASSAWIADALPDGAASIAHPEGIVMYALGKLMLRTLTLGRYPRKGQPHSKRFVSSFPVLVLVGLFVLLTVVYS